MTTGIENSDDENQIQSNEMEFYVVSQTKLLVLFVSTFGLYTIYWFYKHWDTYKKSTNENVSPVMRGIFSIFFVHALFSLFEQKYENKTGGAPKSIRHLATLYLVLSVSPQIVSSLAESGYGPSIGSYASILFMPVTGWILYKAQSLANYAGEDVLGASNSKLTGVHYFGLLLSAALWAIVIFGIFSYSQQEASRQEVRASYEEYFTDSDDRIKMTDFTMAEDNVDITLALSGIGSNLNSSDKEKLQANSTAFVTDKVCGVSQLVEFINEGNSVVIKIVNADSQLLNTIIDISFSRDSCY